jgi:hypothetical protein
VGNPGRFAAAVGWKPEIMVEEGIGRYIDSYAKKA